LAKGDELCPGGAAKTQCFSRTSISIPFLKSPTEKARIQRALVLANSFLSMFFRGQLLFAFNF
jgi:hypothetical protein